MKYLVKRTYQYTTEEWVEAESESEAESSVATSEEERNHDDMWHDSEVIDQKD
tara:strand:- start:33 stop:191 length:159 start_codon:yes stop_codon:yes gene_type:complete